MKALSYTKVTQTAEAATRLTTEKMTPQELFEYASGFKHPHRSHPTVREAAKHFRTTQQAVLDACEDWHGDGYMRPATGFRVGSGVGTFERAGDYLVEAYK